MKYGIILIAALGLPTNLQAQTETLSETIVVAQNRTASDVITALEYEGYIVERVSRTFLGRVQITANNTTHQRRVVVSRTTGEILSDQITTIFEESEAATGRPRVSLSGKVTYGVNVD